MTASRRTRHADNAAAGLPRFPGGRRMVGAATLLSNRATTRDSSTMTRSSLIGLGAGLVAAFLFARSPPTRWWRIVALLSRAVPILHRGLRLEPPGGPDRGRDRGGCLRLASDGPPRRCSPDASRAGVVGRLSPAAGTPRQAGRGADVEWYPRPPGRLDGSTRWRHCHPPAGSTAADAETFRRDARAPR